jgi:hypothetical protein
MVNNAWPGGFFSFMFLTPLYLTYLYSGFNLYASIVALKLVLFFFTLLTAFLLYRITQKVKPAYADTVLLFTLLNPAVLYVNYFWTQVDILPVFFFTLGYVLLRYVDFGGSNLKRYVVGFFPILISAFIYRYALLLVPALVFYDSAGVKQKASAMAIAVVEAGALFAVEFAFFRGELYNYAGALSGGVINMSGVQGFQYWMGIPQLPYLLFLAVLGLAIPLLLKNLKYHEPAALFFVLLLFIYTSAVPLADYFLWLYPIGVLLALTSASKLTINKKLLLTSLPVFVGIFFMSFTIGNGVQSGLFYFAYPLLQLDVPLMVSSPQLYAGWIFLFNLCLLGTVVGVSWFCLAPYNRVSDSEASPKPSNAWITRWGHALTAKKKALVALAVVLLLFLGLGFNGMLSQPVVASNQQVFPLYLFPAANSYDSSPMSGTYYLSWAGLVVYNNWSQSIAFHHPLTYQDTDLNLSFNLQTESYGRFEMLKTDNYTLGLAVQPDFASSNLSAVDPEWQSGVAPQKVNATLFATDVDAYSMGPSSFINYGFNESSQDRYYLIGFRFPENNTHQNLLFHFATPQSLIQYTVSNNAVSLYYNNLATHNQSSAVIIYNNFSASGWNLLAFKFTDDGFYSWVNNKPLSLENRSLGADVTLMVDSNIYGNLTSPVASITQLYSALNWQPKTSVERTLFIDNGSRNMQSVPFDSAEVTLSFHTAPTYSKVEVENYSFTLEPAKAVSFGKLSGGDYGFSVRLNYFELSQKADGYYYVPVYFAVVVPLAVALLSLPLIIRKPENAHASP